jgi:hypothetical protein
MNCKNLLKYIVLLSIPVIGWYCSNNPVNSNTSNIIFERDSLIFGGVDTIFYYVVPQPYLIGNFGGKINLEFDCETNLDSVIGIPDVYVNLFHDGPTHEYEILYHSNSRSEINGHHSLSENSSMIQYKYSLYINLKILQPHFYGILKYITITNFKLTN